MIFNLKNKDCGVLHHNPYYKSFIKALGLTHYFLKPSPLAPLPSRARGTRKIASPLLPFWEKGLGDEGKLFLRKS
jgi:hypothetical protein